MKDTIVAEVRTDLKNRSEHAYEETLDKALYLKRAIKELG